MNILFKILIFLKIIKNKLNGSSKLNVYKPKVTWLTCSPLSVTILSKPRDLWRRLSSSSEALWASMSLSISTTTFKFLYPFSGFHLTWGATSTMTSYLEHKYGIKLKKIVRTRKWNVAYKMYTRRTWECSEKNRSAPCQKIWLQCGLSLSRPFLSPVEQKHFKRKSDMAKRKGLRLHLLLKEFQKSTLVLKLTVKSSKLFLKELSHRLRTLS